MMIQLNGMERAKLIFRAEGPNGIPFDDLKPGDEVLLNTGAKLKWTKDGRFILKSYAWNNRDIYTS